MRPTYIHPDTARSTANALRDIATLASRGADVVGLLEGLATRVEELSEQAVTNEGVQELGIVLEVRDRDGKLMLSTYGLGDEHWCRRDVYDVDTGLSYVVEGLLRATNGQGSYDLPSALREFRI